MFILSFLHGSCDFFLTPSVIQALLQHVFRSTQQLGVLFQDLAIVLVESPFILLLEQERNELVVTLFRHATRDQRGIQGRSTGREVYEFKIYLTGIDQLFLDLGQGMIVKFSAVGAAE